MYKELIKKSNELRKLSLERVYHTRSSHIGCVLSIIDILVYLFYHKMKKNDHFVLSKGHAALGLYSILYDKGTISKDEYLSYCLNGSFLVSHTSHKVSGVEVSLGALGHGLAISAGLALARKNERIYCVLGDGECEEGSIWEALIFIASKKINNITVIIDANNLQGYSDVRETFIPTPRFISMLKSLDFEVKIINGHNFEDIAYAFENEKEIASIIFANTVKGMGVSYMENKFEWHYKSPNNEQFAQAMKELA